MTRRVSIGILFCTISVLAQAQWSKQDSIRLQELLNGDGELKINTEAVKSIHFDFKPEKDKMKGTPLMSEEKPWMKFLKDLPKNFGDTTTWVKPKYVRFTPYTPYTKMNEDPVNDPIITAEKEWVMNIKFGPTPYAEKYDPRQQRVMPPSRNNNAMQISAGIAKTFDTEKFLYENFTARGRAIRRNRQRANAWKTYKDFIPTRQDTLIKRDSVRVMEFIRLKAHELFPKKADSIIAPPLPSVDSLLFENKVNSKNQTQESR